MRRRPSLPPYSGNSRQRLQEVRGLNDACGAGSDATWTPRSRGKVLGGKDTARQQQMRSAQGFGPYQKALREIRYSACSPLLAESGTSAYRSEQTDAAGAGGCGLAVVGLSPRGCLWAGPGIAHLGYRGALQMSLERGVWATSPSPRNRPVSYFPSPARSRDLSSP